MQFDGKVALVTGGASGIGRATALTFAREGAKVVIADLAEEGGLTAANEIADHGGKARFIRTDLRNPGAIRTMVVAAVAEFGRLDFAFNNAGYRGKSTDVLDCTEAEWEEVMAVNLKAVWLCMKYEIPEMLKVGGGAIVNTSSGLGNFAGPRMATYTTSKHAIIGLTRSAAVDFGAKNIRINALLPGATATPMLTPAAGSARLESVIGRIPLGRVGLAQEQAEAVIWLCSDRAAFVSGHSLICDGGASALR